MSKIDVTKYNAQVANAASQVRISSTVFKAFIADVKDVVDTNSPEGRFAADAGSTDTYVVTLAPVPTAYVTGSIYRFKANTLNTGACSVNYNTLGAKTIKKNVSDDLETGDILANQMVEMMYDGTNMQLISASSELKLHKANLASDVTPPHGLGTAAAKNYEEGTFTPVLNFGGAAVGITYATQLGRYQKMGNRVHFDIEITLTSKGSSTGSTIILGLPYASAASKIVAPAVGLFQNLTFVASAVGMSFQIAGGLTSGALIFNRTGLAATNVTNSEFSNTSFLEFSGAYQI